MAEPLAVFHCDSSPEAGNGHLSRCRALAGVLENAGWRTEFAERSTAADLLVVGSRGLHGAKALGSVSERVAHAAASSVLVVA